MEHLARYIIRASFSQERMIYLPGESRVIYKSKDGRKEKVFEALGWFAAMGAHVPNKGEPMVRYYGYYSIVSQGKRKKKTSDGSLYDLITPPNFPFKILTHLQQLFEYSKIEIQLNQSLSKQEPLV